jgi:GNAT superfamily N-acetyltransferase
MRALLRKLTGGPRLDRLDLERDFSDIDDLLAAEEWPFVRSDLEVSHAQPRGAAFVARKDERFAGFFAAHAFGDVAYLDMMIVAPAFRRRGVARPLYFQTVRELERQGVRGYVVHTTHDSARLIRLLGFRPGLTYTLLRREPREDRPVDDERLVWLGPSDREAVVGLDAAVFGRPRPAWIHALMKQRGTRFAGWRERDRLLAFVCLRPRRGGAYCLDLVSATDDTALDALVEAVWRRFDMNRLECFARVGSRLEARLVAAGFEVPPFFDAIGPLVEWRKGRTEGAGDSERMSCLSWF